MGPGPTVPCIDCQTQRTCEALGTCPKFTAAQTLGAIGPLPALATDLAGPREALAQQVARNDAATQAAAQAIHDISTGTCGDCANLSENCIANNRCWLAHKKVTARAENAKQVAKTVAETEPPTWEVTMAIEATSLMDAKKSRVLYKGQPVQGVTDIKVQGHIDGVVQLVLTINLPPDSHVRVKGEHSNWKTRADRS